MVDFEATSADIAGIQEAIRTGKTTRVEVVQDHLDRIKRINPLTNSFVELRAEQALVEAAEADRVYARQLSGLLDGVPVSLKDTYAIVGLRRTDGLPINADRYPAKDEIVVERLRGAGAIILGHAAVPDLCIRWNTISGLYGTTRNPRDLSLTAGGSSGGDAANVAAGLATVGIGGDLGGSVRVPASFCNVYGFRPGFGRVPAVSDTPFAPISPAIELMSTTGPLARTVGDVRRTFMVMSGYHPLDPATADVPLRESANLPRVAVVRAETGARIDSEINSRLDATINMLRASGYDVTEGVAPDLRRAPELWAEILGTDLMQTTLPEVGQLITDSGRIHIEEMFGVYNLGNDVHRYQAAWVERRKIMDELLAFMVDYPLIVAPVAGMTAPNLDFDEFIGIEASRDLFDQMRSVPWVNLFNLPSLALPNGIQIVGQRFAELDVLAAGARIEHNLPVVVASPQTEG
jgi:amidase